MINFRHAGQFRYFSGVGFTLVFIRHQKTIDALCYMPFRIGNGKLIKKSRELYFVIISFSVAVILLSTISRILSTPETEFIAHADKLFYILSSWSPVVALIDLEPVIEGKGFSMVRENAM
jgi:hypothetical protein